MKFHANVGMCGAVDGLGYVRLIDRCLCLFTVSPGDYLHIAPTLNLWLQMTDRLALSIKLKLGFEMALQKLMADATDCHKPSTVCGIIFM